MGIYRQQVLLIIFCAIILIGYGVQIYLSQSNSSQLNKMREMSSHSEQVLTAINQAKKSAVEADLRGRLDLSGMSNGKSKEALRQDTCNKIKDLIELVKDNESQTRNGQMLMEAIKARFTQQDLLYSTTLRDGMTITIPIEQNLNSIESVNRMEESFYQMEAQENALLRYRHNELTLKEQTVNTIFFILTIYSIIVFLLLVYFTRRQLTSKSKSANQIRENILPYVDADLKRAMIDAINILGEGEKLE